MQADLLLSSLIMIMLVARMGSLVQRGLRANHLLFPKPSNNPPFRNPAHTKLLSLGFSTISRSVLEDEVTSTLKGHCEILISPDLKRYMKARFEEAFAQRSQRLAESQLEIERGTLYADRLIALIAAHLMYSRSNSEFSAIGTALCKSVPLLTEEKLQQLLSGSTDLQSLLELHQNHLQKNRKIFDTIQQHHRSIGREDWTDVARNDEALAKYSQAAAAMGAKKWVVECNEWMESFAVGFFKLGGARKHYLREYFKVHDADFSSVVAKKEFINQFTKDLLQEPTRKQIRLLDVGSCYNPIARSENASFFDVTALDLYPADPSVLRCDFLNLTVGAPDSAPVIHSPAAVVNVDTKDDAKTIMSNELAQLPAESFDAVTMSLVLSYLPTPDQRQQMIRKARSLLVTPPPSSQGPAAEPHRTGLLLIVEKDSIFGSENMVETVGQNKSVLLTNWKQAICNEGFQLVKYRHLKTGGEHMSHVFAFATTSASPHLGQLPLSSGTEALSNAKEAPKMWIKQDFDAQLDNLESKSPEPAEIAGNPPVLPTRPVGIIGGGIGGCALALSLQQKSIPFVVFEKDESFETRKQGYALTMQQGGPALRALGLGELLNTHGTISTRHNSYRWDGTRLGTYGLSKRQPIVSATSSTAALASVRDDGPAQPADEGSDGAKPTLLKSKTRHNVHIPRQKLREIMMQNIKPASVLWSKKLESINVQQVEDSDAAGPIVQVRFSDGTVQELCALVGADGIFSTVRQQMQELLAKRQTVDAFRESSCTVGSPRKDQNLKYLGLMVILGIAPNGPLMPADATGTGTSRQQCQWLDGETRVFSMPYDEHHTMWQLSYPCSEADALQMSGAAAAPNVQSIFQLSGASSNIGSPVGTDGRAVVGEYLKQEALRRCTGWAPDLVALLTSAEPSLVSGHPVYDRDPELLSVLGTTDMACDPDSLRDPSCAADMPNGSEVKCSPLKPVGWPITLLGDAAHPMSPFKGQGANQAILDALALSKAISSSNLFGWRGIRSLRSIQADGGLVNSVSNKCDARRSIAENLRLYESEMFAKGAEKVQRSRDAAFYLHNESALAEGNVTRAKAAEDFAAAGRM